MALSADIRGNILFRSAIYQEKIFFSTTKIFTTNFADSAQKISAIFDGARIPYFYWGGDEAFYFWGGA